MKSVNGTNTTADLATALIGLGIAHLLCVCVLSLVVGTFVTILIGKLLKTARDKTPAIHNLLLILYLIVISTCMLGPVSYGILWDISLITGIPVMGNCASYPSNIMGILAFCVFQMLLSYLIGLIALIQLITVKYDKKLTAKSSIAVVFVIVFMSTVLSSAVVFNERDTAEIRGSLCVTDEKAVQRDTAILLALGYIPSFAITIVATVLTYIKIKDHVIDPKTGIIKSVLAINIFNIVQYNIFRATAFLVFYTAVSAAPSDDGTIFKICTVLGRYIADLSYPVTIFAILFLHKSIRSQLSRYVFGTIIQKK